MPDPRMPPKSPVSTSAPGRSPDCGRDLGRALIAHARGRLVDRGFAHAILWVLKGNEAGAGFYQADGWSEDGGRHEDEVWGLRVADVATPGRCPELA